MCPAITRTRHRLDHRAKTTPNPRGYLALCKDAGWHHVSRLAGCHDFSTPSRPPIGRFADFHAAIHIVRDAIYRSGTLIRKQKGNSGRKVI